MVIKDFKKWLSKNDDGKGIFELMYRKMTLEKLANASKSQHLMNMNRIMAACPGLDYRKLKQSEIEDIQLALTERFPHPVSLNMHIITFRKWLTMSGQSELRIHITKVQAKSKSKLPEEMITNAELEAMIKACSHPRDAAMIALLSDSGCRVGELTKMQVKHVEFDEYGAIVTFPDGKTGPRKNRVVFAASYLRVWLDAHEYKDDPDAPLFYSMRGRYLDPSLSKTDRIMPSNRKPTPLVTDAVAMQVKMIAKKAGITRRIHPHLFRHTKATELAPKMPESLLNKVFGWSEKSQTARTYTHNTFKDVENIILRDAGMVKEEDGPGIKAPPKCERCKETNSPHAEYCYKCGYPISPDAIAKMESEKVKQADLAELRAELDSLRAEIRDRSTIEAQVRTEYERNHYEISPTGERRFIATDDNRGDIIVIAGKLQAQGLSGNEFKRAFDIELNNYIQNVVSDATDIVIAERKKQALEKIIR